MIKVITSGDHLNRVMESDNHKLHLLKFTAAWCGPCKAIQPVVETIAEEHKGEVVVSEIDVDKNRSLARTFSIKAMPTFVFVYQNVVVAMVKGANEETIREAVKVYSKMVEFDRSASS